MPKDGLIFCKGYGIGLAIGSIRGCQSIQIVSEPMVELVSGQTVADRRDRLLPSPCNILVAGGAGFIGSHLCDLLLRQGHRLTCLDNMATGHHANIEAFRASDRFKFIKHDVSKPLGKLGNFDEIYNLACPASPIAYQADPIQTLKSSVLGTLNLLELAQLNNAKIFHASTSEIYGDPLSHPQKETDWGNVNPIGPRACYDEGKRCAETLLFDEHRLHGLRIRVARIFNTYGPRMSLLDGRVVSNFIVQALQNTNITIYGDGRQTRSFCYIDDMIDGIVKLMASPDRLTGPINLGNPEEFTIVDLARLVLQLTGSRSRLVHMPLPIDDPRQRCPDITLSRQELGWTPQIKLKDGLRQTIIYFEQLLRKEKFADPDVRVRFSFARIGR
jgi:UDP-glucuronate decarboxylase